MRPFKHINKPVARSWYDVRVTYTTTDPIKRYDKEKGDLVEEFIESEPLTQTMSLKLARGEDATFEAKGELRKKYKRFHVASVEVIGPTQMKRNHTSSSFFKLPA